jgi:hypothetical protein
VDDDKYAEFIEGRSDVYDAEVEPWGSVEVRETEWVTVFADLGGWRWEARGVDRAAALRHLEERLSGPLPDPFLGSMSDYGPPGESTGDSWSAAIPVHVRAQMRKYQDLIDPSMTPDEEP